MQQTAFRPSHGPLPASREVTSGFAAALLRAPVALFDGLLALQRRSEERVQLTRLTDHQLQDMGLSRAEAEEMARRIRWDRPI
jgi:uncharacterized protein YjiS (DUF1127 family)